MAAESCPTNLRRSCELTKTGSSRAKTTLSAVPREAHAISATSTPATIFQGTDPGSTYFFVDWKVTVESLTERTN